jgi:hypothetical protein
LAVAVIGGLVVGIAFVLLFALVMNTIGSNPANFIGKYRHITLSVSGLKDSYSAGEPLNFTLNASGYGAHCIEDPEITIADLKQATCDRLGARLSYSGTFDSGVVERLNLAERTEVRA